MDKIIGGEFEYSLDYHESCSGNSDSYIITSSTGRSALYLILNHLKNNYGINRVLFPDYLCDSIYRMAELHHLFVDFYHIDEHLEAVVDSIENKYDKKCAIFVIDYFGCVDCRTKIEEIRHKLPQSIIIQDEVQCPFYEINGERADYIFTSFRKALPVPDGAWIYSPHQDLLPYNKKNQFVQYKLAASCLKSMRDKGLYSDKIYLELYEKGEARIDNEIETNISDYSSSVYDNLNLKQISNTRLCNASYILSGLHSLGINPIVHPINNAIPLFIPIRLENRDEVRRAMFEEQIFLPVHWPIVGYENQLVTGCSMAKEELSIIIDQRYDRNDMDKILQVLEKHI